MDDKTEKKNELKLIPASLINASHYCRRLAYLQLVHQEWQDTGDTIKGRRIHKRVDKESGSLPSPEGLGEFQQPFHVRSLTLSSESLGLISKIDLLEVKGLHVVPIEYKKGKQPVNQEEELSPEKAQLCVQALVLKDNGYSCERGMIYYAESERRLSVKFTDELFMQVKQIINNFREDIKKTKAPDPLEDSPKCPRCSLVEICLPDEFHFLRREKKIRPISIGAETKFPVYIQSYEGKVSKRGYRLEIKTDEEDIKSVPIMDVSQLVLMGNVSITTPCLHELMRREIPVTWHSYGGWFLGMTNGVGHKNVALREVQYKKSFDEAFCLDFAKTLVKAKIYNCRTILRRNWRIGKKPEFVLMTLKRCAEQTDKAQNLNELLGLEGYAAKNYFQSFNLMIKDQKDFPFSFVKRSRRPPEDPVNFTFVFFLRFIDSFMDCHFKCSGF